ncbi:hypothetical protein [Haladaptatus sp. CMAA 1911]|uniref:hypothetical protein n=1 Tax=unclassified Haladaptatus TaxID=2622732 RepID=UPI0037548D24
MDLPRRFEQIGIVVGSVLLLSIPFSYLPMFLSGTSVWQAILVEYVPGLVVGVLVALRKLPVSYGQVWLFSVICWPMTILLWGVLEVGNAWEPTAFGVWVVALLVSAVLAWAKPRVRVRRSGA